MAGSRRRSQCDRRWLRGVSCAELCQGDRRHPQFCGAALTETRMAATRPRIDVSPDPEALARRVAQWLIDLACHAGGRFSVALSGGSTPKRLYQLLADAPYRDVMPWDRVHWFWGDDRFVAW